MEIIDAHLHFYDDPYFDEIAVKAGHENTADHLRDVYQAYGIRHGVVMGNRGLEFSRHEYPEFLSYCVGLDSRFFRGDNRHGAADLVEKHLQRPNCVGIKLYPGYNPDYAGDPVYQPFYELAAACGKPVAIHTGATATANALLKYSHPMTLDDVATAFPQVQFVMCHFGNPWVMDAAAVLSKNKNVAADLSGLLEGLVDMEALLKESAGYIAYLKTWLGYLGSYDRILYGTDWPLANIGNYIQFVGELIPPGYQDEVFYGNAKRIYQLKVAPE